MELSTTVVVRRRWWLLVAAAILGGVLAYAIASSQDDQYKATVTLLVSQQQLPGVVQLNDLQATAQLANTYREIVILPPVLASAIERGALDTSIKELRDKVDIEIPEETALLEVSVTGDTRIGAADTANILAEAFIAYNQDEIGSPPGIVTIVAAAQPPRSAESSGAALATGAGTILAVVIATGVAFLLESRRQSIFTPEHIQDATGLRTLGRIEQFGRWRSRDVALQTATRPQSRASEGYRATRTSLIHALRLSDDPTLATATLSITSPDRRDGKSTTAANLAVVFGLAGYGVLCVDADMREPTLHEILGQSNGSGLSALLQQRHPALSEALQPTRHPNVTLVSAGQPPKNPSELLGGSAMVAVLRQAQQDFDLVILDSPPALDVTDASVVAAATQATLIVVRAGQTQVAPLQETVEKLENAGGHPVGVLLNGTARGIWGGGTPETAAPPRRNAPDRRPSDPPFLAPEQLD